MPQFLATATRTSRPPSPALLAQKRETDADVDADVAAILADVAARGDAAVIELTERWDRLRADARDPRLLRRPRSTPPSPPSAPEDRAALELAAERIRAYHERQLPAGRPLDRRRSAPSSAGAGRRSPPPASTCRAGSPPTPRRC